MKKNKRVLILAGGTGGHIFPALAVAKQLQLQGFEIRWLGTQDRMEASLVPAHGIEIDFIDISGVKGKGLLTLLAAPWKILQAIWQSHKHIKNWQPDVVLGMGGYVSGPAGVATWINGISLVIHEQNAVAGITNKLLAKIATKVFQAFDSAFIDQEVVGNPLRADFLSLEKPQQRMCDRMDKKINILIMGGSQGANILNEIMPTVAKELGNNYVISHQTGKNNAKTVTKEYEKYNINADVTEFITDVVQAYQKADLVICRSGALTVSEIAAVGVAAIFIPFMHKDRQQALNAKYLVKANAAKMIEQQDLTVQSLLYEIKNLNHANLLDMAINARSKAILDSDKKVVGEIVNLVAKN